MSLERDESIERARAVRLANRDFYVAPLSLRQVLAVADELPKLKGLTADNVTGERMTPLAEIVWIGLHRAHPKMTREEFFDLDISIPELLAAMPTVMQQAGGRKPEADAGESSAASDSTK